MRRISIRDLMWLTLVVALCVGWAVEHYQSPNRRLLMRMAAMQDALEGEGWTVEQSATSAKVRRPGEPPAYEVEVVPPDSSFGIANDFSGHLTEQQEQQATPALRGAYYVESVRDIRSEELRQLKQNKEQISAETVWGHKFVALRDYRCVAFPGGVTGQMIVVERYHVVDP